MVDGAGGLEELLDTCHRLVILDQIAEEPRVGGDGGGVVEEGDHASLLAAGGLYARLARLQFETGAAALTGEYAVHFSWVECVLLPVYFLLGYALFSSLFAGLAATCETEQELQMYMPLAAAPTWLSFAMILLIIDDSNSFWSVAASLFPPTAPIVMFLRMASQTPPAWQFAVSIGLLIVSIWATLWFSSRLYRVGILMYGKRATLPELLRWIRYS